MFGSMKIELDKNVIIKKCDITNNIIIILLSWRICVTIAIFLHKIFEKNKKNF